MPSGTLRRITTAALIGSASVMAACGGAKAAPALPAAAPLAVPAAPARVVVPPAPEPAPPPPEPAAPVTAPATPPSRPARDPKPTPPPTPPATPPAQPATPVTPPPTPLQSTAKQGELEEKAVTLYDAAKAILDKIDRRTLSSDGRAQYDTAVRFLAQSKTARDAKNIVFAWQLAEKAHTIATLLQR